MGQVSTAFGLVFRSEIDLPFDPAADDAPIDAEIVHGPTPETIEGVLGAHRQWQAAPGVFLLRLPGTGSFWVTDGERITVDLEDGAEPGLVQSFLLGSCAAALLHQRGVLTLHASAIATDQGAILFAGVSGIGKSTLLAEFLRRGYRALSDDVVALRFPEEGAIVASPAYPQTKLWQDALVRQNRFTDDLPQVLPGLGKYKLSIGPLADGDMPVRAVICLNKKINGELGIEKIQPGEAFGRLMDATYRRRIMKAHGLGAALFGKISRLTREVPAWQTTRIDGRDDVAELADTILAEVGGLE